MNSHYFITAPRSGLFSERVLESLPPVLQETVRWAGAPNTR
ncbi:hypothetical protein HMPREF0742_00581 [Rothia aeria F0184]|uniref:Uncharacterized protein n=1 Tax=Rothia aeria F0184 TaxID=888019 RepID=U7V7S9_9MICC|nr:hypothetical protein HMPREF0742_00581 [Rothia aeria F0184]